MRKPGSTWLSGSQKQFKVTYTVLDKYYAMKAPTIFLLAMAIFICQVDDSRKAFCQLVMDNSIKEGGLTIRSDSDTSISILRSGGKQLVLRQVAKADERPYIHPIYSPDGKTVITEFRPTHHIHQTGLFWGLKRVNGRDYFMNGRGNYWKRVSLDLTQTSNNRVQWQTVYNLLDSTGRVVMIEEQNWSMEEINGRFILDFNWIGKAKIDVHIAKFYVGGLFVRMPWRKGRPSTAVNAAGLNDQQIDGQRAEWLDVGMKFQDRDDYVHITVLDNPKNKAFPTPWRLDGEYGFGPSRQIVEDWEIPDGRSEAFNYRVIISQGEFDKQVIKQESIKYQSYP